MSVGTADIHKAISAVWNASTLNSAFTDLGGGTPVLNFNEAKPKQSQPYTVWSFDNPTVETRTTGGSATLNREIRNGSLRFDVHSKPVSDDSRGAKQIAGHLIEEIMKVFGGHPTENPSAAFSLDNGELLIVQYTRDYCIRTGNNNYQWTLEYQVLVDVPVAL